MVSDSSGVTVPSDLRSQTLLGARPRASMSSVNEVSFEKFFSTRPSTKVPDPCRRVSSPSATRPSRALRTVIRETENSSASSRSGGRASSARSALFSMAWRRPRCSCWYSGRLWASSRPPISSRKDANSASTSAHRPADRERPIAYHTCSGCRKFLGESHMKAAHLPLLPDWRCGKWHCIGLVMVLSGWTQDVQPGRPG